MAKIKGWERDPNTGDILAWRTTKRPMFQVWISQLYGRNGLWEVETDYGYPRRTAFKTKKEATEYAMKIMKAYSKREL